MNTRQDLDQQLNAFLREGPEELPYESFDAVRDRSEQTRQRVILGPWRLPEMNKFLAVGLGAVAVVAVLLVGSRLLGSFGPSVGGEPSATPSPSATSEPSPTPDGFLPEGPYVWSDPAVELPPFDGGPLITVTIPASGWTADRALMKGDEVDNLPEAAMLLMPTRADVYVYGDPCRYESTKPDTPATTIDEIAAALAAQPSRDASAPVDVTVGGYAGKFITLHVPDDASPGDCEGAEYASFYVEGDEVPGRYHQGGGQVDDIWILDVDGAIVIIDGMYRPDSRADLVDEMRSIAESATFD